MPAAQASPAPPRPPLWRAILNRRMLVSLVMGFSCGLPLLLTITLLQAWMKDEGIDLTLIGLMALVGLPYTIKFLWAPLLDRYTPPFLGRRRGWMLVAQVLLMAAIVLLGLSSPGRHPWLMAAAAFLVTFFSASQDIVVDAYRREDLSDQELGLGSSFYVNGYRVGMLLASGGGLLLADHLPFSAVYALMAACLLPGVLVTLLTPEPPLPADRPRSLGQAVLEPFREYFGRPQALLILGFILTYKIGESMATSMTTPFYLDLGFSKSEIGAVVKLFGFGATLGGSFLGGLLMLRLGTGRCLWGFGILQGLATLGFTALAHIGHHVPALAAVITLENVSAGMGTAAYMAFMAQQTNKRFTATQYALLSSLMGIPRVLASAPTGLLAKHLGWSWFFIFCTLAALPGLALLLKLAPGKDQPAPETA